MNLKVEVPKCLGAGINSSGASAGTLAIPTSFDTLVEDIRRILGDSSGIDSDDVDVEELMEAMSAYQSDEHEWQHYALRDKSRGYCRNGVDNINSKANLLILVWNPGRGSLIHDHANAHCIVKVLKGSIRETLYNWPGHPDEELKVKRVRDYGVDQVSYMSDKIGLHRMENIDPTNVAVSLHLYTPPYAAKCK
jgi:cysteine dioxygenase